MELGKSGTNLIESFEELRLAAYLDQRGIPTIGYGHTSNVNLGDTCTETQADEWFVQDTGFAVFTVKRCVDAKVNQNQFDALVSICFNIGAGNFRGSTLVRLLNGGETANAADQFLVWNKCKINGVETVDEGLVRRRAAERALFVAAV